MTRDEDPAAKSHPSRLSRWSRRGFLMLAGATTLSACGGMPESPPPQAALPPQPETPQLPANVIGTGAVKVGLILPLGASGNAALAAQSLRNSAEMAMAEFTGANIQIIVKDDGGTAQGAQAAATQVIDEGARAILGPLFAHSVASAGQVALARGIPVVGFSTDTNVARQGVYLLSFLPQTDVERAVRYCASINRRSFIAMIPDNPYGSVVEAAFRETVPKVGGRIMGLERYASGGHAEAARRLTSAAGQADAVFLPDSADVVPQLIQALAAAGINPESKQLVGTGLWDDTKLFQAPSVSGGIFAAPDPAGFRAFAGRYRQRFGREPVRTATLSHDAVSLMAALVGAGGEAGINDQAIQNPSGFSGIDGIFRFRNDGTNQRGLAIMQIRSGRAEIVNPAPRSFAEAG